VDVSWQLQASWQAGYVAQLIVSAPTTPAAAWTVSWPDPHAIGVANAWGMNCTKGAGVVSCTGADWAAAVPAGGSVTVGLQMSNDGAAPSAPALTVS
jgi:endoglucanase